MIGASRQVGRWLAAVAAVASIGLAIWWVSDRNSLLTLVGRGPASTPALRDSAADPRGTRNGVQTAAIAVEIAIARAAKISDDIRAVGSLQSEESIQLAPEISGRISEIVFVEGRPVKKGDVLVKLDDALVSAEVLDTEARLALASANNDRARTLAKTGNVTGRGRDEATANFETARAAVELAKTRLSKHTLLAPFDGIAGVRAVSVGAYVSAGTPVTNIEKIDTLKVDFKVPELFLEAVKVGQSIELIVDALPGRTFEASIYALNPLIDVNGRALQVRARLENKDARLRPGLFARISIKGLAQRDVITIPEASVVPRAGDAIVYVVENDRAIEKRVKLGQRANAEVEVIEGIQARARVVTAGQQKLRDGALVEVTGAAAGTGDTPTVPQPPRSENPSNDPQRGAMRGGSG
jgi:membrane fusion protein, multidrug efflux system